MGNTDCYDIVTLLLHSNFCELQKQINLFLPSAGFHKETSNGRPSRLNHAIVGTHFDIHLNEKGIWQIAHLIGLNFLSTIEQFDLYSGKLNLFLKQATKL